MMRSGLQSPHKTNGVTANESVGRGSQSSAESLLSSPRVCEFLCIDGFVAQMPHSEIHNTQEFPQFTAQRPHSPELWARDSRLQKGGSETRLGSVDPELCTNLKTVSMTDIVYQKCH